MGKAPAFQFYPNDWTRDLEEHPLEIEGAWIRICCKLWWSETRGKLTKTCVQWGRILRVSPDDTIRILKYIQFEKIGKIPEEFSECNHLVTVISRRMVRDEKAKENNRLKVNRWREKKARNQPVTGKKPLSSSSSSSSSVKAFINKSKFSPPSKDEINNASSKKLIKDIEDISQELYDQNIFPDVFAFKNKMLKTKKNKRALLHTLNRCLEKKTFTAGAYPYCVKIMKIEEGNFNERDHQKASEKYRPIPEDDKITSEDFKKIKNFIGSVGRKV